MHILPIDDHITAIDHNLLGQPGIGVTYVVRGEETALIETGTSLTVVETLAGLDELDIPRDSVGHIICTHIHMDHAGGAGYLAEALPRANVYIHQMTMPHLAEPTKLMESSRRAVGEEAWALTGDMKPVAEERLHPADTLLLDLGQDIVLEALPTPGHSPDHVSFWDKHRGGMFLGDAAGLAMPRYNLHFPVTPVPTYDVEQHRATIEMLRELAIQRLYVTHWGVHDDVDFQLRHALERLEDLLAIVNEALETGNEDIAALAARYVPYPDDGPAAAMVRSWSQMSVAGMLRYEKKRRQAR